MPRHTGVSPVTLGNPDSVRGDLGTSITFFQMTRTEENKPKEARTEAWPMLQDMIRSLITGDDELANINSTQLEILQHALPAYIDTKQIKAVLKLSEMLGLMLMVQSQMRKEVGHAIS